jgi:hypothetical protein
VLRHAGGAVAECDCAAASGARAAAEGVTAGANEGLGDGHCSEFFADAVRAFESQGMMDMAGA